MPRCTICDHPKRNHIDTDIAAGHSQRSVAKRYGITPSAVQRHGRIHLPARIEKAMEKREAKANSIFAERLELLWDESFNGVKDAKRAVRTVTLPDGTEAPIGRDLAALAPLLAQAHRNVEILGKHTGELSDGNATSAPISIQNAIVMLPREGEQAPRVIDVGKPRE